MSTNIELIGEDTNERNADELRILKRIINAHSEDQSKQERIKFNLIGIRLRMNNYLKNDSENKLIPAGHFLNEILTTLKIKKSRFAEYIGIESPNLHAILKGRRRINNRIAEQMASIFNIDEEIWLYIEAKNDMKNYKKEHKKPLRNYSISELVS